MQWGQPHRLKLNWADPRRPPRRAIINFSSSVVGRLLPAYTGYAASKAAVEAMTFIVLDFGAWGWNHRTGEHAMRVIFGGVFDKFPGARIILGHMGEFVPAQLFRIDIRYRDLDPGQQQPLNKLPSEYFGTNIAITTSGVFSHQALTDAIQTIGIDNVMFSIDYPYESTEQAAEFMRTAPLAPADKERVAHANAERILRLNP